MKKIIPILLITAALAACNTKVKNEANTTNAVLIDTTGLSKDYDLKAVGDNKFVIEEKEVEPIKKPVVRRAPRRNNGDNNNANTNYSSGTNTSTNAAYPQDKGWSHAAKGTAVGGGSGAILGAVLNKDNRVGGAIVGSVIGAGAGYVIGRSVDKKTGRVDRAKARKDDN